ncbi:hypothetical protein [Nocardioides pakistanensis]
MAALGGDASPVVWVPLGNTRRTAQLAWFEPLIAEVVSLAEAGNRVIVRR